MSKIKNICCKICGVISILVLILCGLFIAALIKSSLIKEPNYQEWDIGINGDISQDYLSTIPRILGDALTYRTTSHSPGNYNTTELLRIQPFFEKSFPHIYKSIFVDVEIVNNYSILYSILGKNNTVEPYLLAAHLDVVPVDPDSWDLDPWLGEVILHPTTREEVVWGRGAIDDKACAITMLAALDYLLSTGWEPNRSFYIAFGHDEEVGGMDGAAHIAEKLKSRNVTLQFVLDEGMPILDGIMNGIEVPVATIGVTEKGWMNIRMTVEGTGGHSSIPPHDQAVERISKAISALYDYPQPSMFGKGPEVDMLTYLAPQSSWPNKLIYANNWLFKPIIEYTMLKGRETSAIIRTTTAVTIVNAGIKDNVIPATAEALINHRVHPSQTLQEVLDHDNDVINDPKVKLTVEGSREAHPISPYGPAVDGYRIIASSVKKLFPDSVPVPSLMIANTDTRHYLPLSNQVYRFQAMKMNKALLATIHGHNEYVPVTGIKMEVDFYHLVILAADMYEPLKVKSGFDSQEL